MKMVVDFKILQEYGMLPHEIKTRCTNAFKSVAENKRDIDFYTFKASLYIVFQIEDPVAPLKSDEADTQAENSRRKISKNMTFGEKPLAITDGKTEGTS